MTSAQTMLARQRLRLGIVNVGFWVTASIVGLAWIRTGRHPSEEIDAALLVAAAVAIQAVFDVIGGFLLLPGGQPRLRVFLRKWARGVTVHGAMWMTLGYVAALSLRWSGGFCSGMAASIIVLALGRQFLHGAIHGFRFRRWIPETGEGVLVTQVDDPSFTGGHVGFGSDATILLPETWCHSLPIDELRVELSRRRWAAEKGLPLRTLLFVLLWNLTGCCIGNWAFDFGSFPTGKALIGQACWMTLWSFLGLLVLPGLSRFTVFAADQAAIANGLDPSQWIRRFPTWVGEDGSQSWWVETIFYPIPSADRRIESLEFLVRGPILGNLARSQLFYSLAGLTLLGRAVHCNVGRPALWVFPPTA